MSFLIISCSLNPHSRSHILAQAARTRLAQAGVEVDLVDMRDVPLPYCDGDSIYDDPAVLDMSRRIQEADGILVATPIYNYDVNSVAKNLLEVTGSAWTDKIVGFLCAAGGRTSYMSVMPFANSLMLDFRCIILPRFVFATEVAFHGHEIVDDFILERLDDVTATLIRFVRALAPQPQNVHPASED